MPLDTVVLPSLRKVVFEPASSWIAPELEMAVFPPLVSVVFAPLDRVVVPPLVMVVFEPASRRVAPELEIVVLPPLDTVVCAPLDTVVLPPLCMVVFKPASRAIMFPLRTWRFDVSICIGQLVPAKTIPLSVTLIEHSPFGLVNTPLKVPAGPVAPVGPCGPVGPAGPCVPSPFQTSKISLFEQTVVALTTFIVPLLLFTQA